MNEHTKFELSWLPKMGCATAGPPQFPIIPTKRTHLSPSIQNANQKPIIINQKSHLYRFRYFLKTSNSIPSKNLSLVSQSILLFTFSLSLLIIRVTSNLLLPNFSDRWRQLVAFSSQAEAELLEAPEYLIRAVVACEDRRFFSHWGVDPIGVARAVLSLSARGGGSTITQQLVKNAFLKNERRFSRKIVELVLALALERRITKLKILSAYLCMIYWGHGNYGIKSASNFYFGKNSSHLSLSECALLVGIIPAPESRSPFRDYTRGKIFQSRVLKRMVDHDFLDIETALCAVKQSVSLKSDGPEYVEKLSVPSYCSEKELGSPMKSERGAYSSVNNIWDLETRKQDVGSD